MRKSDLPTSTEPLGPIDFHDATASDLQFLDVGEPFSSAMATRPEIIFGRKGSGKSAAIKANHYLASLKDRLRSDGGIPNEALHRTGNRFVVYIETSQKFDQMVRFVDQHVFKTDRLSSLQSPTTVDFVRDRWIECIWMEIITYFRSGAPAGELDPATAVTLQRFEDQQDLVDQLQRNPRLNDEDQRRISAKSLELAIAAVRSFLAKLRFDCIVLFDTLEDYLVTEPIVENALRGFLPAVHKINSGASEEPSVRVIVALPDELRSFFLQISSNSAKDFRGSFALKWGVADLLRLTSYRIRMLIEAICEGYERDDSLRTRYNGAAFVERLKEIKSLDLHHRPHLSKFFDTIFPDTIENDLGYLEDTVAYISRHTFLLPRHILIIITNSINESREYWRQNAKLSTNCIREGVLKSETEIFQQVVKPFTFQYPDLEELLSDVLRALPYFFSGEELEFECRRVSSQLSCSDVEFANILFHMGAIGLVRDTKSDTPTARFASYAISEFYFNGPGQIDLGNGQLFCFHPVFGRRFAAGLRRLDDMRHVYPRGLDWVAGRGQK